MNIQDSKSRRDFLNKLLLTGASGSVASLLPAAMAFGNPKENKELFLESEEWFKKIKGSHRVVFDGSTPHDGFPVIWNWAFYFSNNQTGSSDDDLTGMSVLRHSAVPFALKSELWEKYELGAMVDVMDNKTQKHATRNPFYEPGEGDMPADFIQGIKDMQSRGAMFCVCDLALNVYSGAKAQQMGIDPAEAYEDWKAGILPDIQLVPSGVWALERAQSNGCSYIFAGN